MSCFLFQPARPQTSIATLVQIGAERDHDAVSTRATADNDRDVPIAVGSRATRPSFNPRDRRHRSRLDHFSDGATSVTTGFNPRDRRPAPHALRCRRSRFNPRDRRQRSRHDKVTPSLTADLWFQPAGPQTATRESRLALHTRSRVSTRATDRDLSIPSSFVRLFKPARVTRERVAVVSTRATAVRELLLVSTRDRRHRSRRSDSTS